MPCQIVFQIEMLEMLEMPNAKKELKLWSISECSVETFPMTTQHFCHSQQTPDCPRNTKAEQRGVAAKTAEFLESEQLQEVIVSQLY